MNLSSAFVEFLLLPWYYLYAMKKHFPIIFVYLTSEIRRVRLVLVANDSYNSGDLFFFLLLPSQLLIFIYRGIYEEDGLF